MAVSKHFFVAWVPKESCRERIMPRTSGFLFCLGAFVVATMPLWPQIAVPARSFEVASIREHPGPLRVMKGLTISGTLVRFDGYTALMLVQEAYGMKPYEVTYAGQPLTSFYDIMARASGDVPLSNAEMRQMLQTLLAERFRLKVHHESRELDVYVLAVARIGSKLKESPGDGECHSLIGPVNPADRNYRYSYTHCPLSRLVESLSLDRPVVDGTGLTGYYDIAFAATPEFRLRNSSEPGDASVFDVLQSGQGLRLEPRKAPIDVLVIDHVEQPVEN
jgi:uncharacterized protein (TIGR03435 family)